MTGNLDQIREAVEAGKVTQGELAQRSGLSKGTVSLIIRRKTKNPSYLTVVALLQAFADLQRAEPKEVSK